MSNEKGRPLPGSGLQVSIAVKIAEDTQQELEKMDVKEADKLVREAVWSNICLWLTGAIYCEMAAEGEDTMDDVVSLAGRITDAVVKGMENPKTDYVRTGLSIVETAKFKAGRRGIVKDE